MRYIDDLSDLGDDLLGSLDLADVGARRRRRAAARGRALAPRKLIPRVPGVPGTAVGLQPMPLGTVVFTAASGLILQMQASPQRPFKGQRLVITEARVGATGGLVNVTRLEVGTYNQMVFGGNMPAAAFAPTAFDTNMFLQPATPGVNITLLLTITAAPAGADTVTVSAGMWGTVID